MGSINDTAAKRRWRLVRLGVVLLGVMYLTALSFLLASSTSPGNSFDRMAVGATRLFE
jgi:hypothetical protein